MKNELVLDNYGVQELQAEERIDVEGGMPAWLWQSAVATFVYNCIADWDENVKAFNEGRKAAASN